MAEPCSSSAAAVEKEDDNENPYMAPQPFLGTSISLRLSTAATGALPLHPVVLACGHRSVLIPKSRLVFPAWLVLLPSIDGPTTTTGSDAASSAASTTTTTCVARCVWRSKRDWSRLGRAVRRLRAPSSSQPPPFSFPKAGCVDDGGGAADAVKRNANTLPCLPKAAMDRLVQDVPWTRPDLRTILEARDCRLEDHSHVPKDQLQVENRWNAQWTKSLERMDDCLRRIHELVLQLRRGGEPSGSTGPSSASRPAQVLEAWQEFCRPMDADNLVPEPDEVADTAALRRHDEDAASARGNALGQYFCSADSASRLVAMFVSESRRHVARALAEGPVRVTVVEPSCGDGRLLRQLGDALREDPLLPPGSQEGSSIRYVGMDIDEQVLEIARRHHGLMNNDAMAVEYVTGDFLSSRRFDYEEKPIASCGVSRLVLIIGGPPYSAGAGIVAHSFQNDAADGPYCYAGGSRARDCTEITRRNLPLQFVGHAIEEHGASVVCFLMPERYRNCQALQDLLERHHYVSTTLDSDSLFYFQGGDSRGVTQPSVLQCYSIKKGNDEARV